MNQHQVQRSRQHMVVPRSKLCFAPEEFSISCLAPSINGHVSTDVCPNNICHDSPMVQLVLIHDRVFSSIQTNCTCARPFYIHCIEEKKSHNEFNIISEEYFWQPFLYCKNHYLVKVAKWDPIMLVNWILLYCPEGTFVLINLNCLCILTIFWRQLC